MIRTYAALALLLLFLQTPAFGQGILDSIFGPGGLSLWGPSQPAGGWDPSAASVSQAVSMYPPGSPEASVQEGYPQQYQQPHYPSYPQQGYVQQPQVQTYPPPYPQQPPQGAYPQPSPQGYQQPGSYQYQYIYPGERQAQVAPGTQQPPVRVTAPQQSVAPVQGHQPVPGQYQQPRGPLSAEELPPGAVQMTTTTPAGTTVHYYPPPGTPAEPASTVTQPRSQPKRQPQRRVQQTKQPAPAPNQPQATDITTIAQPKPVQIPTNRDPRMGGWGSTSPASNEARGSRPQE